MLILVEVEVVRVEMLNLYWPTFLAADISDFLALVTMLRLFCLIFVDPVAAAEDNNNDEDDGDINDDDCKEEEDGDVLCGES